MKLIDTLSYTPAELSFGTSGLRGLVTDMTDLECYINTVGFVDFLRQQDEVNTIYIAGDLRKSTPRILKAVLQALSDEGVKAVYCGLIPTPALAFYALTQQAPCIMVTGSHIPDDRNGIKFYKQSGEVLKPDETAIKAAVANKRQALYSQEATESPFNVAGMLIEEPAVPEAITDAADSFKKRYTNVLPHDILQDKTVVVYQHSAVGRDMLVELLEALGAQVITEGRSETFVPIDTENVTTKDQQYFHELAKKHPEALAIVSTDGDSDRPFVIDSLGNFYRGDILGAVIAQWLKADFAAYPISSNDIVDRYVAKNNIEQAHTKIGSPYVIDAMNKKIGTSKTIVGWEVNGGVLLGSSVALYDGKLDALPTRDAFLPILGALTYASEQNQSIAGLFSELTARHTQAGLIDNFPTEVSKQIIETIVQDEAGASNLLTQYFTPKLGFGAITEINALDGVRIYFDNGDIAHLRPSGNAPQLRIYSVADSQERADKIVADAISEPNGIFRTIEKSLAD